MNRRIKEIKLYNKLRTNLSEPKINLPNNTKHSSINYGLAYALSRTFKNWRFDLWRIPVLDRCWLYKEGTRIKTLTAEDKSYTEENGNYRCVFRFRDESTDEYDFDLVCFGGVHSDGTEFVYTYHELQEPITKIPVEILFIFQILYV